VRKSPLQRDRASRIFHVVRLRAIAIGGDIV
jgi:hypothetical protein